jgi:hypothetical protein
MVTNKRWLISGVAAVAVAVAGVIATASLTQAETIIEITPTAAASGVRVSIGQCPCFRWAVEARGLGGTIETDDILISTEALFRFQQDVGANFQSLAARTFTIGAIEALVKGGHVGVGFNGVQFGSDPDRGYSSLLRTGFYILANIIKNDSIQLDAHAGYDWDRFVAIAGASGDRGLFDQAIALKWNSGPWSGNVSAHFGMQADSQFFSPSRFVVGASASARVRVVSFSDFEMGLSASLSAEHDGFREMLGLNPNNAIASLLMDISWVERSHTN